MPNSDGGFSIWAARGRRRRDEVIEFFYDCSSPWTYLGFESIEKLANDVKVPITWKPFLVGAVFNAINQSVYTQRENPVPAKWSYMLKDMQDYARLQGLSIRFPPTIFPVNSANAMRACIVADRHGLIVPFSRRVFQAYWSEDRDISSPAVIGACATEVGLDADELLSAAASEELRSALRLNTDELIARGGFGTPTVFVAGSDMYFGNDRIPLVRHAVAARRAERAMSS
jgi:2-hydroxychromene-2-carboxylate isomerase